MQFSGIVCLCQALHETLQKWGSVCPLKPISSDSDFRTTSAWNLSKKRGTRRFPFDFEQFHLNQKTAMQKRQRLREVFNAEMAHLLEGSRELPHVAHLRCQNTAKISNRNNFD
jgi:hypothetical protein